MSDNPIEDLKNSEVWKTYEKEMLDKEKFLKKGPNIIHLQYLGSLFSENDFKEYEEKLCEVGLELSRLNSSGVMYACLDKFDLVTYFAISQPIIGELIKGIGTNATWDVIKSLLISGWNKIRNKTYIKATSQSSEKKEITFGLKVHLDKNTNFNISLKGDLDESVIQNSIDKVLDFLREQKINETFEHPQFVYYDVESDKWIKIDSYDEIGKMIKNGNQNKK